MADLLVLVGPRLCAPSALGLCRSFIPVVEEPLRASPPVSPRGRALHSKADQDITALVMRKISRAISVQARLSLSDSRLATGFQALARMKTVFL